MARPSPPLLDYLQRLTGTGTDRAPDEPDAALLERFVHGRDEAAFAALVRRHGTLVWGICRRILCREVDAEDAFQATFLVLVRKAGSVRRRSSLRCWLHGVAFRVAAHARDRRERWRETELKLPPPAAPAGEGEEEVHAILDEEIERLPEKYRQPVLLCYLEGMTNDEAAAVLGCPRGTVATRLARARQRLRRRLARRGLGRADGELPPVVPLAVPVALAGTTGQTALSLLAGGPVAGPAIDLMKGVVQSMFLTKVKVAFAILSLALALLLLGAGVYRALAAPPGEGAKADPPERSDAKRAPLGPKKKDPGLLFTTEVDGPGRVAFSRDGKAVTWAGRNGAFRIWEAVGGKEVQKWAKKGWSVADLSADGKVAAVRERRDKMHILDTATGKDVCLLDGETDFYGRVNAFALSPDGRLAAANFHGGAKGYRVRIWDAVTGKEQDSVEGPERGSTRCMAFSPDNKLIVLGLDGTDIEVYDLTTRKRLRRFGEPRPVLPEDRVNTRSPSRLVAILSVTFSPDGKTLAAGNNDGGIDLYAVSTGKHLRHLGSGPRSLKDFNVPGIGELAFSGDGKTLLSVETFLAGRGMRRVYLWDLATGKKRPEPLVTGPVYHAALSADSKKLAAAVVEEEKGVVKAARVEVWEVGGEEK